MPLTKLCCWFLLVHMFLRVVKLCEVLRVLCLSFSCVHDLFLFIVVSMCAFLFLFIIVFMCVGFKSQDQWSSMCTINSFKWAILCPWLSFVGVFYLLMCFSWSWSVYEALAILHLLFSSMIRTLMFCVCTVLLLFDVVLYVQVPKGEIGGAQHQCHQVL